MWFFCQLLALQLAMAGVLWIACDVFVQQPPPSLDMMRHVPVGLLVGCLVACTGMLWRAVDPLLNRIGLELLANAMRLLGTPVMIGWYLVAVGTFGFVLATPGAAASGWSFAPLMAVSTLLVLVCAAVLGLAGVLTARERRSIDQARALLESLRATHPPEALARLQTWLDWRRGEGLELPPIMNRGSYFPGLRRQAWHDAEAFEWERELQAALPRVREELLAVYGQHREDFRKYNYPGSADRNWKVFPLFRDHQKVEAHCARCPETTRLVERITGGLTRDVMLSLLEPGAFIPPHRDSDNLFLAGEYGLVVPEACALRVGLETRTWGEGRSLLFDPSFEHEVWNRSAHPRLVLLYEFLHPDLTAVERHFFATLYRAPAFPETGTRPAGAFMKESV